jgi:hypothetical protein
MNEVSIIINGVRYDAVEHTGTTVCDCCDLLDDCSIVQSCDFLIGGSKIFKKSNKKFEK